MIDETDFNTLFERFNSRLNTLYNCYSDELVNSSNCQVR